MIETKHDLPDSDSPSPAEESPPFPSSGPAHPFPASYETAETQGSRWMHIKSEPKHSLVIYSTVLYEIKQLTGSVRSSLSSSNTVWKTWWTQLTHHWLLFPQTERLLTNGLCRSHKVKMLPCGWWPPHPCLSLCREVSGHRSRAAAAVACQLAGGVRLAIGATIGTVCTWRTDVLRLVSQKQSLPATLGRTLRPT